MGLTLMFLIKEPTLRIIKFELKDVKTSNEFYLDQ